MTTTRQLISSRELCLRTGATYRQVDYWQRTGILAPTIPARGSGSAVRYDPAIIDRVRAMVALSHVCVGKRSVAPLLQALGETDGPWELTSNGVRITVEVVS